MEVMLVWLVCVFVPFRDKFEWYVWLLGFVLVLGQTVDLICM